jgi:hypothetical protein
MNAAPVAPRPSVRHSPPRRARPDRRSAPTVVVLLAGFLAGVLVYGTPYYRLPVAERVRDPLHAWLRPSGYVGQSAGIIALLIFGFLWLYPLRKRVRWLAFTGSIARWLDVHVSAALLLPLLVTIHAGWRFGGVIGLGFWAMMVVWLSGVVGRYLYARIPRGRGGLELNREEIAAEQRRLLAQIASETGVSPELVERTLAVAPPPPSLGPLATLRRMVADDLSRRRAAGKLRALSATTGGRRPASARAVAHAARLARREMALTQQVRMLDATHDLFRYWHVAHRPVAIAALVAVLVHVVVVVAVGATWLR